MQRRSRQIFQKPTSARSVSKPIKLLWLLATVLVVAHLFLALGGLKVFKHQPSGEQIRNIRVVVIGVMQLHGVKDEWMRTQDDKLVVSIPTELPYYQMYHDIVEKITPYNAVICSSTADLATSTKTLEIGFDTVPVMKVLFKLESTLPLQLSRVAIIIDDFGYGFDRTTKDFINLPIKLTLSVIPGQKYSARIASEAYRNGKEVMVHLPMEPLDEKVDDKGYTIFTGQTDSEIRKRVRAAVENIPFTKGINNHKGSKATADARVMKRVLSEIKDAGLYFVDSRTSFNSIGSKSASEMNVPRAERNVFLDAEDNDNFIQKSLDDLCSLAKKNGTAVGIGHAKKRTLNTLKEYLPKFNTQGIELVLVSDIVK